MPANATPCVSVHRHSSLSCLLATNSITRGSVRCSASAADAKLSLNSSAAGALTARQGRAEQSPQRTRAHRRGTQKRVTSCRAACYVLWRQEAHSCGRTRDATAIHDVGDGLDSQERHGEKAGNIGNGCALHFLDGRTASLQRGAVLWPAVERVARGDDAALKLERLDKARCGRRLHRPDAVPAETNKSDPSALRQHSRVLTHRTREARYGGRGCAAQSRRTRLPRRHRAPARNVSARRARLCVRGVP